MATDEKDNPTAKKSPPRQVVITHYGKKKTTSGVPSDIEPRTPTEILSSPVGADPGTLGEDVGEYASDVHGAAELPELLPLEVPAKEQTAPFSALEESSSAFEESSSALEESSSALEESSSAFEESSSALEEPSSALEEASSALEEASVAWEESSPATLNEPSSEVEALSPVVEESSLSLSGENASMDHNQHEGQVGKGEEDVSEGAEAVSSSQWREEEMSGQGSGRGGNMRGSLANYLSVVSLIAVIGLGFYSYSSHQDIASLKASTQGDQAAVLALSDETKAQLAILKRVQGHVEKEQQSLNALKGSLENRAAQWVALTGDSDWVLSQANYLAFMANERLKAANDVPTAIKQLEASDEQLRRLANPAFIGVREALAKDISQLKAYPAISRQVIWEQLGLMENTLSQLRFKTISASSGQTKKESSQPQNRSFSFKAGLMQSWNEFKDIIRISKESDNPIPAVLSEEAKTEMTRAMILLIMQAQWAVLQGNSEVYKSSLLSFEKWLYDYFAPNEAREQLLVQTKSLVNEPVAMAAPDISATLNALSEAMSQVSRPPSAPEAPPARTPGMPLPLKPAASSLVPIRWGSVIKPVGQTLPVGGAG